MIARRVPWMLLAAMILFLLVLGVSRVADFGILPGEDFGAGDVQRNEVEIDLAVLSAGGARTPIGRVSELAPGDRLELSYGPTRYPYLWVVAIEQKGEPARPLVAGKLTPARGETLLLDPPRSGFILLCMFSAVPRTLEQIRAALDEGHRLPGLRFSWVIGGGPKERAESAQALP